jgi:hypothetical protein
VRQKECGIIICGPHNERRAVIAPYCGFLVRTNFHTVPNQVFSNCLLMNRHQKRKLLYAAVCVVAVCGVAYFWFRSISSSTPVATKNVAAPAADLRVDEARTSAIARSSSRSGNTLNLNDPAFRALVETSLAQQGFTLDSIVDVCGLGKRKISSVMQPDSGISSFVEIDRAWSEIIDALQKTGGEQTRALASYLEVIRAGELAKEQTAIKNPGCIPGFSPNCDPASDREHARAAQMKQLIEIAESSRDPSVFAMAYQQCQRPTAVETMCNRITAARWRELDRDNVLARAHANAGGEIPAEARAHADELLDAMSRRGSLDPRAPPFSRIFELASFRELPPHLQLGIASLLQGEYVEAEASAIAPLGALCDERSLQQSGARREHCEKLAQSIARNSHSAVKRHAAAAIAAALGWPKEKIDELRKSPDGEMSDDAMAEIGPQMYGCDMMRKRVGKITKGMPGGFVGNARTQQ